MPDTIIALRVPKWGLSMKEGRIGEWIAALGQRVVGGDELLEIETDKITNVLEAPTSGILRRKLVESGETLKVGRMVGILADPDVAESAIDAFVEEHDKHVGDDDTGADQEQDVPMRLAALGERLIAYSRVGPEDAETVILIHGFAADSKGWMMTGVELAGTQDVVIPDLPGHGGSTKSVGNGSITALAEDLDSFLGVLDIPAAHLVGHSMGSAVALELARTRPERVKSLSLIAPIGLPGTTVSAEFLRGVLSATRQREMRQWLEMLVADPRLISRAMVDDVIKSKRRDGAVEALKTIADRLCVGDDLRALEHNLPQGLPTIVIAADADRIAGQPDATRLPENYHVEHIIGVGHMPHVEASRAVNALIRAHIERTRAETS